MRVLVTGSAGQLGRDLVDVFSGSVPVGGSEAWLDAVGVEPAAEVLALGHAELDVADADAVRSAVQGFAPDVVVHAAAWTAVDACESDPDRAMNVNGSGTMHVAEAASRVGATVVYVSTDYVFDGTGGRPYVETDEPNPLSRYGKSKLAGERALDLSRGSSVARTSWVSGYHGANMTRTVLKLAPGDGTLRFVDDQHGSPTFTADLAPALAVLAKRRLGGVFHLTNSGTTSWHGFARAVLEAAGEDPERVLPIATADLDPPRPAPRPANSVLDNAAWRAAGLPAMPPWQDGLRRLVAAIRAGG